MKTKNFIEFNGKQYDVETGEVLNAPAATAAPRTIDGVFKASAAQPLTVLAPAAPAAPQPRPKPGRQSVNHFTPHQPQHASTLMRSAVKKPGPGFKQQATVQSSLQHKVPSLIAPKMSASTVHPDRLARAASITKSPHINRHTAASHHIPVQVAPLAVQPIPVKPEAAEPGVPSPQPTNKPHDIFEAAIANASHYVDVRVHRQHFRKRTHRHLATMAAGTLALLVIAGYAAYQNSPSLQLQVASLRAGVSGHLPNIAAAGFTYTNAQPQDGKLVVDLRNGQGSYQLVQQQTNWSSDDLIQNLGSIDATGAPDYTTVKAGNTDIYRFSNNSAAWVSDGTWYQVSGSAALSDSQLSSLVQQ